jgi:hypothetical protein
VGRHPAYFGKNRQRDIHGLGRQIDSQGFPGLKGGFGFEAETAGADIDSLADFEDGVGFAGEQQAAFKLNGMVKGLTRGEAMVCFQGLPFLSGRLETKAGLLS